MTLEVTLEKTQIQDHRTWFLADSDLSSIALDTETMGVDWLPLYREIKATSSEERLKHLNKELSTVGKQALDPVTSHLAVVQLATACGKGLVIVCEKPELKEFAKELLVELMALGPVWLLHNSKFDYHQLAHHMGLDFAGQRLHDTQLCEVLLLGNRSDASVSLFETQQRYPIPEEIKKIKSTVVLSDWWGELTEEQIKYASNDVFVLHPLAAAQKQEMERDKLLRVRKLECDLTPHLVRTERSGAPLDREKLFSFLLSAKERRTSLLEPYSEVFDGINPNSPKQVLQRIKDHYGVEPTSTKYDKVSRSFEVKASCDKAALLAEGLLEHEAVRSYIGIKEIGKRIGDAEKWLELPDALIKFKFFQLPIHHHDAGQNDDGGTRTGRLSTSPNMQNQANFMKQFIRAPEGWLIGDSDYGAIELRLLASVADETTLKQIFNEGRSPHVEMCEEAFKTPAAEVDKKGKQYRIAKEINFGFPYGMGGPTFCGRVLRATNGEIKLTEDEGWEFRGNFFSKYPGFKRYHQLQAAKAYLYGYVQTLAGRRRYYNKSDRPVLDEEYVPFWSPLHGCWVGPTIGRHPIKFKGETKRVVDCRVADPIACYRAADWRWKNAAYNTPIQGGGADGCKDGFRLVSERFDWRTQKLFTMVHDSNAYLFREDKLDETIKLVNDAMLEGMQPHCPDVEVTVEHSYGRCWANPPKDIVTDDYGLWVYPKAGQDLVQYTEYEYQKEYKL